MGSAHWKNILALTKANVDDDKTDVSDLILAGSEDSVYRLNARMDIHPSVGTATTPTAGI